MKQCVNKWRKLNSAIFLYFEYVMFLNIPQLFVSIGIWGETVTFKLLFTTAVDIYLGMD